jgi:hypothetical protein
VVVGRESSSTRDTVSCLPLQHHLSADGLWIRPAQGTTCREGITSYLLLLPRSRNTPCCVSCVAGAGCPSLPLHRSMARLLVTTNTKTNTNYPTPNPSKTPTLASGEGGVRTTDAQCMLEVASFTCTSR